MVLASITTRKYGPLIVHESRHKDQRVLDLFADDPLNEAVGRLSLIVEADEPLGDDEFYFDPGHQALQDDLLLSGLFQPTGRRVRHPRDGRSVPIWRFLRNPTNTM